jgi:hypothetical protein
MPQINGRLLQKEYQRQCPTCHGEGHLTSKGLDYDQYWILDYEGNESPQEGTWLYDRVAYPTLVAAQRQHLEAQAYVQARRDRLSGARLKRQRAAK